jgi:hypothetical protein
VLNEFSRRDKEAQRTQRWAGILREQRVFKFFEWWAGVLNIEI